jgi:hypothetical protein
LTVILLETGFSGISVLTILIADLVSIVVNNDFKSSEKLIRSVLRSDVIGLRHKHIIRIFIFIRITCSRYCNKLSMFEGVELFCLFNKSLDSRS